MFDLGFKAKLLREIEDLDGQTDGVIIHSDNFQGLNLLQEKYRSEIDCIYIDPPYNAQSSEILYKNTFKHSSWITLMENRISVSKSLLSDTSVSVIAIDEVENSNLAMLLKQIFPASEISTISVVHNPTGQQGKNFSFTHEFAHFIYPKDIDIIGLENRLDENRESSPDVRPLRNVSSGKNHYRNSAKNCFYPIFVKDGQIIGFGDVCEDDFHPSSINVKKEDGIIEVYPIDPAGQESKWNFARHTVDSIKDELKAEFNTKKQEWDIIRTKYKFRYKSLWSDKRYSANSWGSAILNHIIPDSTFLYPKSIFNVKDSIDASLSNKKEGLIIDYFAGSGTTAHATIALNREDNGNRKYILIEQGDYFNTVIKPRIQKVIYSENWKDGEPALPKDTKTVNEANPYNGISHCLKVIKLESYEDTLNNLELRRTGQQQQLFDSMNDAQKDDYLMHYMLELESKGSILSVADFAKPFDYQLKITSDSAGAYTTQPIDLIDTFNYLIGLNVQNIDYQLERGYVFIEGTLRTGEKTLVFWRDTSVIGYEKLEKTLLERLKVNPKDREYQLIYLNGDHNIPSPFIHTEDGERKLKIRSIEQTFFDKMFEE